MIVECLVCGSQLSVEFYARLEHHDDGSHTVQVVDVPDVRTLDRYDDFCPTCDAISPMHTPECAVLYPNRLDSNREPRALPHLGD